ncbi:MAG TPA: NAD(P)-dependent alcohol dehydrogenase [Gammaproteobacteria bacterium]|nr:NAD(P)-dependent alcohol dehydrogenase [Gammaproteobacteria bacterium]
MQAVIQSGYGPIERVLSVGRVPKPVPNDDEVLVRVRAASMHPDVWHVIVGFPFALRFMGNGVLTPRPIPGTDIAGVVEAVGKGVTRFKPGDEVFGECAKHGWINGGAYAEYVAVPQDYLALKPSNVSFEQAAAVPTAGTIALNNLGGVARPKRGSVLINGAGGCMGTIALQIAKADGAYVTAVDCAAKLPMLRALGADRVIDYEKEDYRGNGERYDFILDVVQFRSPDEYRPSLTPQGEYIPIGHAHYDDSANRLLGDLPKFLGLVFKAMRDPEKRKTFKFPTKPEALEVFRSLLAAGKLTPVIGKTFGLSGAVEAMKCMQQGELGRVIITP